LPSLALPEGPANTSAAEVETERERLTRLVKDLPVATVRGILAMIDAGAEPRKM